MNDKDGREILIVIGCWVFGTLINLGFWFLVIWVMINISQNEVTKWLV